MLKYMTSDSSHLIICSISFIIVVVGIIGVVKIFLNEGVIQHIKDDWTYRLLYRIQTNRYRGLSRPSYVIICFVYYVVKTVFLLVLAFDVYAVKFLVWDFWKWLFTADKKEWYSNLFRSDEQDCDDDEEEESLEFVDGFEELPFCQLFTLGPDMCLLVDHIEMDPDEVAFIRVVDDEGYTPLYKRKVRRDKVGNRFIVFNGSNHYLDDNKTQPVITRK